MPWKVIADREELGEEPPGAAVRQPGPHLRQCPLVFGGAAVGDEFRCRAKRRPRRDRAWAGFEARRRHLDRAEQRIQPPGPRVLQRPKVPATRAAAAHRAVLGDPGLNQMPLHARQQSFAVVQCQAERIERRMGIGAATASDFVGLRRSIGATQFDRHTPFHSRPLVFRAATVAPPCLGRSSYSVGGQAQDTGFTLYFFNSIFIATVSILLALIIGTLAAFGFSRYPLKGNDTYLFIILSTRMLPAIVVIIPIFLMFRVTGLAGTYPGIIALYTAFNLPFTIWMMKSFFDELSPDVEDAARIDGSSDVRVFFKICLPQVIAGLAATAVFGLILTWNEFLFALLLSGVETRTVPVAMAQTIGGDIGVRWGLLAAIETLFLIPVIIVTFALQNQLLRGVTFGTIKR